MTVAASAAATAVPAAHHLRARTCGALHINLGHIVHALRRRGVSLHSLDVSLELFPGTFLELLTEATTIAPAATPHLCPMTKDARTLRLAALCGHHLQAQEPFKVRALLVLASGLSSAPSAGRWRRGRARGARRPPAPLALTARGACAHERSAGNESGVFHFREKAS